jgi:hypothetical protein
VVLAAAAMAAVPFAARAAGEDVPLIGTTYTHTAVGGCDLSNTGIVQHYDSPGVRRLARSHLAAMHDAGLQTIRILLWNMSDITGQQWGIVPSAGGSLPEPYRSNLLRFVSDIKAAGFTGLTIDVGPEWTNNPIGDYGPSGLVADRWDPSKLEENWHFFEDVHKLVAPVAPPIMHWDPISEGPPSRYQPSYIVDRMESYIATMWQRYVAEFDRTDFTVSSIAKGGPVQASDVMQHLIDAVRSTGLGFPAYFEVHPDWSSPEVYEELVAVDQTLRANGLLTQPLVVGESSYENAGVAGDIARFMHDTGRRVSEVYEWWQQTDGGPCTSAPYRADAYIATLTGRPVPPPTPTPLPLLPVPRLRASLSRSGVFTLANADGSPVSILASGEYRIVLKDGSTTAGIRISGPGFDVVTTGKRFTGTRTWNGDIGSGVPYGTTFHYGSTAHPKQMKTFVLH